MFFPHQKISQVPTQEVQAALCRVFEKRNKPGSFRVDNGEPLGSPSTDIARPLALWLIAHDIDMIWNKPRTPQMNGVVEHLQDTSSRWAEIEYCESYEELQRRLDEESFIQRCVFPVSRLKNRTRLEVFPDLEKSNRTWQPNNFSPQRVYDFLAKKIFTRKVSANGQINHCGQKIVGFSKLKGQFLQLKLNPQTVEWEIYHDYKMIKKIEAIATFSQERLLNLSVYQ